MKKQIIAIKKTLLRKPVESTVNVDRTVFAKTSEERAKIKQLKKEAIPSFFVKIKKQF